jgi:imidazolonepropionase-like amidohydrolase
MQNTMAKLSAARVPLVLGTDDGAVRDHFYAFTAHRELKLMTDAGLKPADVLTIATKRTAEFLRLNDYGTLEPGKRGDFLVLDANPLDDIVNTRTLSAVYRHGEAVDRRRLAAGFR